MLKTYDFSEETIEALVSLSHRFDMPIEKIIETLVLDRHSMSDRSANARRRDAAWREYRDSKGLSKGDLSLMWVWINGYDTGWLHFQTRHKPDAPMLEIGE